MCGLHIVKYCKKLVWDVAVVDAVSKTEKN